MAEAKLFRQNPSDGLSPEERDVLLGELMVNPEVRSRLEASADFNSNPTVGRLLEDGNLLAYDMPLEWREDQ